MHSLNKVVLHSRGQHQVMPVCLHAFAQTRDESFGALTLEEDDYAGASTYLTASKLDRLGQRHSQFGRIVLKRTGQDHNRVDRAQLAVERNRRFACVRFSPERSTALIGTSEGNCFDMRVANQAYAYLMAGALNELDDSRFELELTQHPLSEEENLSRKSWMTAVCFHDDRAAGSQC
ncbi:hypothetical protein D9M71_292080 [compost metagenome]